MDEFMTPQEWLLAKGANWQRAVDQAADCLMDVYRSKWPEQIPTDIHRLALTLGARIDRVSELSDRAKLVPIQDRFLILVRNDLNPSRYRMAVAHELAHTLFYRKTGARLERLFDHRPREEHFCIDVARRILAPRWMLDRAGIRNWHDVQQFLDYFLVSKSAAARILLADYGLLTGVASRWFKDVSGTWMEKRGTNLASPCLGARQRKQLRETAKKWLTACIPAPSGQRLICYPEHAGSGAYVLVTIVDGSREAVDCSVCECSSDAYE